MTRLRVETASSSGEMQAEGTPDEIVTWLRESGPYTQGFPHNRAYMDYVVRYFSFAGYYPPQQPAHMTAFDFLCFLASCGALLIHPLVVDRDEPDIDTIIARERL